MSINEKIPDLRELRPRITVFGVGGAGGNAVNNMIRAGLQGVDFVVANTDAQALTMSEAERIIQMGVQVTEGLGAGSHPDVGRAAADEVLDEIRDHLSGAHMVFVTAGMGGGTGTGASPVIARAAREMRILTVGVVTKPFHFEGQHRMRMAEQGIVELQAVVDTLIIIQNQNLFRVANEKTTFADAFVMADQVLYSGVGCITDLMVKEGLINLDFADVRAVMREMGKAMMGTGEATGEKRASHAAEAAIANPLINDVSMKGARALLISIAGGKDLTLFEVDEAATRIREEADPDANIIVGAAFDESLDGVIRVSVVATGVDQNVAMMRPYPRLPTETLGRAADSHSAAHETRIAELAPRLRAENKRIAERLEHSTQASQFAAAAPETEQEDFNRSAMFEASIDAVATAAVARALFEREIDDVTIRSIPPKATFLAQSMAAEEESCELPPPAVFIPAQPKRPAGRPRRMPRINELPIPV
jgi:cell division protein FtsZ